MEKSEVYVVYVCNICFCGFRKLQCNDDYLLVVGKYRDFSHIIASLPKYL